MRRAFLVVLFLLCTTRASAAPQLTLTWMDTSTNEDSFRVERRTDPGGSFFEIGQTGVNIVTYVDLALILDQRYCYRVRAANRAGFSGYSNEACDTYPSLPLAPSGLTVTAP